MVERQPDEMSNVQDDAIEIDVEVEVEDAEGGEGPSCEITWEDGQAIVQCESEEDAQLAAELLTSAPVRVVTKKPEEGSSNIGVPEPDDG